MLQTNQLFTDRQSGKFELRETFKLLKWERAESSFRQPAAFSHAWNTDGINCHQTGNGSERAGKWDAKRKKGTAQGGKERSCQCWGKTRRNFWECFSLHINHNELGVKLKGQIMYYERVLNDGTYALTYFKWYVLKTLSSFYAHVASFSS